jgi:nuclear pore complex protein Nup98-Nup96
MKPEYGQGLNKKAIVTLYKVWPTCRVTGKTMRDPADLNALNYKEALLRNCHRFSGKFLNYSPTTGNWVFEIQTQN